MKKIITSLALFFTLLTFAQVPQGISYQAIALNGAGNPVVSSNVGIRISVLDNSATGTVLYTETHTKTTNAQGLFNLVIGQGTPTTGTFSTINWATNSKFLKVEMDAAGGSNYALVGTTQLLSVPYALMAGSVSSVPSSAFNGLGTNSLKGGAFVVVDGNNMKGFYNGAWSTQAFTNFPTSNDVVNSNGNFVIVDGNNCKGFCNGVWSTQSFSNFPTSNDVVGSNGNFVVTDGTTVKGFYNGVWSTQSFSNFPTVGDVVDSNGSFVVLDGTSIKGFHNGIWTTQTFTNFPTSTDVVETNGRFLIVDGTTVKGFYNGVWSTQTFTNFPTSSDVVKSDKN